jgi:2-polyprenyl-3-methyl-5-hydroxy-6-metoxy-1,4-benzoquinol methylase
MVFEKLDIESEAVEGEFDLILAANVLHATKDMRRTMRHVYSLLAPGGVVVAPELTSVSG